MYLSRIKLNPALRKTAIAMMRPSLFHGGVESAFSGERKRRLWRLDTLQNETYLLLLSDEFPDLTGFAEQFGFAGTYATKDYTPLLARIAEGSVWRFRLTANPTIAKACTGRGSRGKVYAHITEAFQAQWLLRQANSHGFALNEDDFMVTQSRWYQFYKRAGKDSPRVTLLSVTYEGILTVTDAERFRETLCQGIGREKSYGMGLLTVVRAS